MPGLDGDKPPDLGGGTTERVAVGVVGALQDERGGEELLAALASWKTAIGLMMSTPVG